MESPSSLTLEQENSQRQPSSMGESTADFPTCPKPLFLASGDKSQWNDLSSCDTDYTCSKVEIMIEQWT